MISESYRVINKSSGKYILGSFNKDHAITIAKNKSNSSPNNEYEVIREIVLIDCVYNSKHNDNVAKIWNTD